MAANGGFRAICGLSHVENHVHGLTVCRASCRPGQACYHHHRSKKPVAFADLVEPASLLVLDARNLDREIVQEFQERVDYSAKRHPSSPGSSINSPHGLILFDGVCVLCSRGCGFVSKRDRRGYITSFRAVGRGTSAR
jgi:hypothetical protein